MCLFPFQDQKKNLFLLNQANKNQPVDFSLQYFSFTKTRSFKEAFYKNFVWIFFNILFSDFDMVFEGDLFTRQNWNEI